MQLTKQRIYLLIGCHLRCYYQLSTIHYSSSPCHLVPSVLGTLATIMESVLHCFLSFIMSLSSANFIPVTSCIPSMHLLLGRTLLLLPSLHASIIPFSSPSDCIICPK